MGKPGVKGELVLAVWVRGYRGLQMQGMMEMAMPGVVGALEVVALAGGDGVSGVAVPG